ncbi:hypothetical protein HT031_004897 [Scenedesmus sp. PABB004]|nr:hypothetical protein HT031_004897 [Scenedesmus sp. PABB004]
MNGLGCRVHNAVLATSDDGGASDVFWVTDMRGRKLSDASAADVADRLEEFVSVCAPTAQGEFTSYACGDIAIDNTSHPRWTEVAVTANIFSPGLLFEMASIFHGQGLVVCEGVVRGGSEDPIPPELLDGLPAARGAPPPPAGSRVMRFWVKTAKSGAKLDYADVSALLYTLRVVLGDGGLPTRPPNSELNALACDCPSGSGGGSPPLSEGDDPDPPAAGGGALARGGAGTAKGRVSLA